MGQVAQLVQVDAKHAMPRAETMGVKIIGHAQDNGSHITGMRKIFVGGLPPGVTDQVLRQHFEQCGEVDDAVVMMDHHSKRSRGFGFVTFKDEATVEHIMRTDSRPVIFGKAVEVKRAVPREQLNQDAMIRRRSAAPYYQGFAHTSSAHYPHGLYQHSALSFPGALQQQQAGVLQAGVHQYFIPEVDMRVNSEFGAPPVPSQLGVSCGTGTDVWRIGEHMGAHAHAQDFKSDISFQAELRTNSPSPIHNVHNLAQFSAYKGVPQDLYGALDSKGRPSFTQGKTDTRSAAGEMPGSFESLARGALPSSAFLLS